MKTLQEWLSDRGIEELGTGEYGVTRGDVALAEQQADMLLQRFGGLLHHLSPQEKAQVVARIMDALKSL